MAGSSAEHSLGFFADGLNFACVFVDRDNAWLAKDDTASPDVNERVSRSKVNADVSAKSRLKSVIKAILRRQQFLQC